MFFSTIQRKEELRWLDIIQYLHLFNYLTMFTSQLYSSLFIYFSAKIPQINHSIVSIVSIPKWSRSQESLRPKMGDIWVPDGESSEMPPLSPDVPADQRSTAKQSMDESNTCRQLTCEEFVPWIKNTLVSA